MNDLALQIGRVDRVGVDNANVSDAGGRQIEQNGRAQSAGANHQYGRVAQGQLAAHAYLRQDQVARIALDFGVGQDIAVLIRSCRR